MMIRLKWRALRFYVFVLWVLSFASCLVLAQTVGPAPANRAAFEFAQKAAVRTLHFTQGDAGSLRRARADLTPEAWNEFMKQLQGFVDENGAPAFSSNFTPSGQAVVVSEEEGVIHLKIPGTITQTRGASRTSYSHSEIDVKAGGQPVKIEHLEVIYKAR